MRHKTLQIVVRVIEFDKYLRLIFLRSREIVVYFFSVSFVVFIFAECSLATFGTGIGGQRIPFVYLPLKGQIIHPSREITFQSKCGYFRREAYTQ